MFFALPQNYAVMSDGQLYLPEAVGFLVLYIVYVIVVVVGRQIYQKRKRDAAAAVAAAISVTDADVGASATAPASRELRPIVPPPSPQLRRAAARATSVSPDVVDPLLEHRHLHHHHQPHAKPAAVDDHTPLLKSLNNDAAAADADEALPVRPWAKLAWALVPIDVAEFVGARWYGKVYAVLAAPVRFALTLSVPVVDEEKDDHNWNWLLQALQCVVAPLFLVFSTGFGGVQLGGGGSAGDGIAFPLWALALVVGAVLAALTLGLTGGAYPPRFHVLFAYGGFFVAVVWIYMIANEIVNVLQTLGRLLHLSDAILGLTVLAWGNSISDFVANLTVAKQGFPQMAVGASFGGPAMSA